MNPPNDFRFVKVDEEALLEFLRGAKERILIAKAGYSCSEVETLIDLVVEKEIECKVFLDPGENAIRWGFGQEPALRELNRNRDLLNLQTADRIRMSIVIVDNRALIYTPVALAWETEPKELKFPNGFIGGPEFADTLIEQISPSKSNRQETEGTTGQPETPEIKPPRIDNVIPFPGCTIPPKKPEQIEKEISQTIGKLEKNPAVDPTKLRKITVYRNNYKLLKYQVKGAKLKNKSISLRPFNNLFPDLNDHLKASWRAFTNKDMENVGEVSVFLKEIGAILKKYTMDVGRFGYLIKTDHREAFEKEIEKEEQEFLEVLGLSPGQVPKNKQSKYIANTNPQESASGDKANNQNKGLGELLAQSRSALTEYMLKVLEEQDGAIDGLFFNDRTLFSMLKKGEVGRNQVLPGVLDTFISQKLKFPEVEEIIDRIDVTFDYYDVSSELLYENEDFKQAFNELKKSSDPKDELKIREFSDAFEQEG